MRTATTTTSSQRWNCGGSPLTTSSVAVGRGPFSRRHHREEPAAELCTSEVSTAVGRTSASVRRVTGEGAGGATRPRGSPAEEEWRVELSTAAGTGITGASIEEKRIAGRGGKERWRKR